MKKSSTLLYCYAALLALAGAWISLRGDSCLRSLLGVGPESNLAIAFVLGLGSGLAFVLFGYFCAQSFDWAKKLEEEFKNLLGPLSIPSVIMIALVSSFAEEFFFRAAMQPVLGLTMTSLTFGLLHIGPGRVFLPWTILATLMGFYLGWLFEWTGSLIAPITCHLVINAINLFRLSRVR